MTIPVEIMLRGDPRVYAESIERPGDPATWTPDDMRQVLEQVLGAVSRAMRPGAAEVPVQLRGMNWIVSPYQSGVVLAIEVHSASVVAGPFDAPAAALEALIVGALGSVPPGTVVH
jgi:hypothetical protein